MSFDNIPDDLQLLVGDCRDHMRGMAESSFDAIVTDPPYGLSFMGKGWDHGVPGVEFWELALRALKPGGYLLAFGGTRTFHRLAVAIEDAGFEIRDTLMWLYGSGFPKSLNVSKAIDKAAGAEREVVGVAKGAGMSQRIGTAGTFRDDAWVPHGPDLPVTAPATGAARQWDGWGTALKPAWEPIIMARKPLIGTVTANVLQHGTGAINVDGCRIGLGDESIVVRSGERSLVTTHEGYMRPNKSMYTHKPKERGGPDNPMGRWPANVLLDEDAAEMLDAQSGDRKAGSPKTGNEPKAAAFSGNVYGDAAVNGQSFGGYGDTGGASRFFYVAKASRSERNAGLEGMPERESRRYGDRSQGPLAQQTPQGAIKMQNVHPTVKPVALMRWLVRLVTPPGGHVLDPFAGSGTTGVAAIQEGFSCTLIEMSEEYVPIIEGRTRHAENPEKPHRTPTTPTNGQMELFSHEL